MKKFVGEDKKKPFPKTDMALQEVKILKSKILIDVQGFYPISSFIWGK